MKIDRTRMIVGVIFFGIILFLTLYFGGIVTLSGDIRYIQPSVFDSYRDYRDPVFHKWVNKGVYQEMEFKAYEKRANQDLKLVETVSKKIPKDSVYTAMEYSENIFTISLMDSNSILDSFSYSIPRDIEEAYYDEEQVETTGKGWSWDYFYGFEKKVGRINKYTEKEIFFGQTLLWEESPNGGKSANNFSITELKKEDNLPDGIQWVMITLQLK